MLRRLAGVGFVALLGLVLAGLAWAAPTADPCPTWKQTLVTVGTSSTTHANTAGRLPTGGVINSLGQLSSRQYVTICQSKATSSTTALLTVRVDGFTPASYSDGGAADGGPEPSPALAWGDCIKLPVPENVVPRLVSTEASTVVSVFECGGVSP